MGASYAGCGMATGNVTGKYLSIICLVINCTDTTYLLRTVTVLRKGSDEIVPSSKVFESTNVMAI